jgi:hypothetical protein
MIQSKHAATSVQTQREQARVLLDSLESACRECERIPSESNSARRDLFKKVTGHSSLENAIDATRRAIEAYDRMLENAAATVSSPKPMIRVTATGVPSVL